MNPTDPFISIDKNEKPLQYTDEQIKEMRASGAITDNTLFWLPGMPSWQPLSLYVPGGGVNYGRLVSGNKKPASIQTITKLSIALFAVSCLFSIPVLVQTYAPLFTGKAAEQINLSTLPPQEIWPAMLSQMKWIILSSTFAIASFISLLIWYFKANRNCHALGAPAMKYSPGWAVACNIIPILNLFKPYSILQEMWKASKNPANWQMEASSPTIKWYWTFYIFYFCYTSFMGGIAGFTSAWGQIQTRHAAETTSASFGDFPVIQNPTMQSICITLAIIGGTAWIISLLLQFKVMIKICRAQQTLIDKQPQQEKQA